MSIPIDLTKGLYSPDFEADSKRLNDFVEDPAAKRKQDRQRIQKRIKPATTAEGVATDLKAPLTEDEAREVDLHIDNLRSRLKAQKQMIAEFKSTIDQVAGKDAENEFNVTLNIKNRPSLQKAIQLVFGVSTDKITYSMYKAAVDLKRQIEGSEVDAYIGVE